MKNSNFGSNGAVRAVALLLEELFVVATAVILSLMAVDLYRVNAAGTQILHPTKSFEQSDAFQTMVRERLDKIVDDCLLKGNFERNGHFYGRKIVDLAEYVENGRISGQQQKSVGYYLEDLIRWSRKGLDYSYVEPEESGAVDAVTTMPEAYTFESGSLDEGPAVRIELQEEYVPVRGRQLFDYVSDLYGEEDLLKLLEQALQKVGQDYQDYQALSQELDGNRTNVRFFVEDYNGKTTCSNFIPGEYLENDTIKTLGKYLILDGRTMEYESNMRVTDVYLYDLLDDYSRKFGGNYYLELGVDTEYPAVDAFYAARENYTRYYPRIRNMVIFAVLGFILILSCLIVLTVEEGKDVRGGEEEGETRLLGVDRIKTEPAAILFGGGCFLGVRAIVHYAAVSKSVSELAVGIVGAGIALLNLFFLLGYLSMVRRIKAGTLYKDSLFNWILEKLRYIYKAGGLGASGWFSAFRAAAAAVLVLGLNWFLVYRGSSDYEYIYYVAALILDLAALILVMYGSVQRTRILRGVRDISGGNLSTSIETAGMTLENAALGEAINEMSTGLKGAVQSQVRTEKLRADLITNVSHDIKTPLTSIINYVGLLKQEGITGEKAGEYIDILEQKSMRLKALTEDMVEASKITSGNISIEPARLDFGLMISQMEGEICEKFQAAGLTLVTVLPEEPAYIMADGRRLFRVLDNIYNNVAKYAMPETRVYADLKAENGRAVFTLKNVSRQALNFDASELTERFIRGDVSRSTEGSGLGLSIAQSLTELQGGRFTVYLDGDLFKVTIDFALDREVPEDPPAQPV